jgi:hypothetical protein
VQTGSDRRAAKVTRMTRLFERVQGVPEEH